MHLWALRDCRRRAVRWHRPGLGVTQRLYRQRGGPRRGSGQAGGHNRKLDLTGRLLATRLRQHLNLPPAVIGDGFVMVTPEYNHSTSGVLKNAIDYLDAEWRNKAVGLVSYGGVGGARASEHLRLVCGALQMADVSQQVALSLMTEFENFTTFKPGAYNATALDTLLDQAVAWSTALAPLHAVSRAAV